MLWDDIQSEPTNNTMSRIADTSLSARRKFRKSCRSDTWLLSPAFFAASAPTVWSPTSSRPSSVCRFQCLGVKVNLGLREAPSRSWQRERCEAYCKANDYSVVAVYEEREVSGGRADNRPQLQAALDHVCKLKGTLVVYSLDRLARNVDDARAISKRLERADANLAILQMRVDTTTPYGKLFFTIVAAFAEFY